MCILPWCCEREICTIQAKIRRKSGYRKLNDSVWRPRKKSEQVHCCSINRTKTIVSSGSKSLKSTAARLSVVSMVRGTSAFTGRKIWITLRISMNVLVICTQLCVGTVSTRGPFLQYLCIHMALISCSTLHCYVLHLCLFHASRSHITETCICCETEFESVRSLKDGRVGRMGVRW